jgi:hypothetical protein
MALTDIEATQAANSTIGLLIFAVAIGLALYGSWYVYHRYDAAWTMASDMRHVASFAVLVSDAAGMPPLICNFDQGGFTSSSQNTLYIMNNEIRQDSVVNGNPTIQHYILMSSGVFAWTVASTEVYRYDLNYNVSHSSDYVPETIYTLSCQPWWRPDSSLFQLPTLPVQIIS